MVVKAVWISFVITLLVFVLLLCLLAVCLKRRYKNKRKRSGRASSTSPGHAYKHLSNNEEDEISSGTRQHSDEYQKHIYQLTSAENKTADQIRRKYRNEKGLNSQSDSDHGPTTDQGPPKMAASATILQTAMYLSKQSSLIDDKESIYHFNKAPQKPIGMGRSSPESKKIPVPIKAYAEDVNLSNQHPVSLEDENNKRQKDWDEGSSASQQQQQKQRDYLPSIPPGQASHSSSMSEGDNFSLNSSPASLLTTFAENASLHLSVKYIESTDCIVGSIKRLQNINMNAKGCPKDVSFHLKLLPKGKYRMKTPWRVCGTEDLALTFTIGPVKTRQIIDSQLCVRLYGRMTKHKFSRPKCYGECMVKLNRLFGVDGDLHIIKKIVSKSHHKSSDDLRFTTDEESEYA